MNKEDEITKILRSYVQPIGDHNRDIVAIWQKSIPAIATEIEKLYEGKVVYVAQHLIGGLWHDAYTRLTFDELTEILKADLSFYNEKGKRRLLKRTTTDQIF